MSLLHTVRNVQRVRHIATVLIKHGFGQVIEKLDLEYRIFVKKFAKTSSDISRNSLLQNAHAWCLRNSIDICQTRSGAKHSPRSVAGEFHL